MIIGRLPWHVHCHIVLMKIVGVKSFISNLTWLQIIIKRKKNDVQQQWCKQCRRKQRTLNGRAETHRGAHAPKARSWSTDCDVWGRYHQSLGKDWQGRWSAHAVRRWKGPHCPKVRKGNLRETYWSRPYRSPWRDSSVPWWWGEFLLSQSAGGEFSLNS